LIKYYQKIGFVRNIGLSYIAPRYLGVDYSENVARKPLRLAEDFIER